MNRIKLGDWIELIIKIITFGFGERMALFVAKKFYGRDSCGCCERKEWLNRLTDKEYDGKCNQIKLF